MLTRRVLCRSLRIIGRRYYVEEPKGRERIDATTDELVENRRKTITKGEALTSATDDPQLYYTSLDDNYQRTTVQIINRNVEGNYTAVGSLMQHGFRMHDKTVLLGPIALFPKITLSWMVPDVDSITEDSLTFFTLLEPKLDLLIIGVGDKKNIEPVTKRLLPFLRKHRLHTEILSTMDACATFNYLNCERRQVAAVLFPPDEIQVTRKDILAAAQHYEDSGTEQVSLADTPLDQLGLPKFKGTRGVLGNLKNLYQYQQQRLSAQDKEIEAKQGADEKKREK